LICLTILQLSSGQSTLDSSVEPKVETLPCGGSLVLHTGKSVAIETPNYPDHYGPYDRIQCSWKIKVPRSSNLSIDCKDFDLHKSSKFCVKDKKVRKNTKCYKGTNSWLEDPYEFPVHDFWTRFVIVFKSKRRGRGDAFRCILSNNKVGGECGGNGIAGGATTDEAPTWGCGISHHKIVGGQAASANEWPWQVGLLSSSATVPFCGGSLISPSHVLTAAHCTQGATTSSIAVTLGEHDISDSQVSKVSVCRITDHPAYSDYDYDFSLLELCSPVEKERTVSPVCLPADGEQGEQSYSGQVATATGWGTLNSEGARPDLLMEVNLTVLTNQECLASYDRITESMLCAFSPGKDSCQGDSGGPLVTTESNRFTLIGVTSHGRGCARPDHPGVYARVSYVMDWIAENSAWAQDSNGHFLSC